MTPEARAEVARIAHEAAAAAPAYTPDDLMAIARVLDAMPDDDTPELTA